MSRFLAKLDDFFTADRRRAVYRILGILAALAVTHGLLTADDAKSWLEIAAELAGVGGAALAHRNVNKVPAE
jgi:hypothetical protein